MKELTDLTPEVQEIAVKALDLREVNAAIVKRIEKMGPGVDLALAKLEHILEKLIDAGVITDEWFWATQLDWEEGLQNQLVKMEIDIKNRIRAARELEAQERAAQHRRQAARPTVVQQDKRIVGLDGRPLTSE